MSRHRPVGALGSAAPSPCYQTPTSPPPRSQSLPSPAQLQSRPHLYPLFSESFNHLWTLAASPPKTLFWVCLDPHFHPQLLSEPLFCSLGKFPTLPTRPSPVLTPFQVPLPSIQATRTVPWFSSWSHTSHTGITNIPAFLEVPCKGCTEI